MPPAVVPAVPTAKMFVPGFPTGAAPIPTFPAKVVVPKLLELPAAVTLAEKVPVEADNAPIVVLPKLLELPAAVMLADDTMAPEVIGPVTSILPLVKIEPVNC